MEWILPLERINLRSVSRAGGKAARLGALLQAGFNVPAGFVITADAFLLHHPVLLEEPPPPPVLTPAFRTALADAFRTHFAADEQVAVRSSAIDEDGAGMSFAGQHATYYYVTADRLEQAVIDCWRSLWSPAALAYRQVWDQAIQPMAVIVQRLVRARRSGVCFSRDPLDPVPGTVVIEASWGLGAALVDGRVQPDRLKVDEKGAIVELQIGDKQVMVPSSLVDPTQTRLDPVPEHLRTAAVLTHREAIALHEATEQIEVLFDQPVDVEWAWDDRGLHILQARPITTAAAPPVIDRRLVLFKPVAENFSEPMTPMTVDLFASILPRIGRFVRGRLYLEFDRIKALLPLKANDAELVDILLLRRTPDSLRLSIPRLIAAGALGVFAWLGFGTFWSRSARVSPEALEKRFVPWIRRQLEESRLSVPAFTRRVLIGESPFAPVWQLMLQLNISAGRYFLLLGLLRNLIERWAPGFDPSLLGDLVHDDADMWSKRMVAEVATIARIAAEHPDSAAALGAGDLVEQVRALPPEHPFLRAFGRFLTRFGHRAPREIDFSTPRWREDATPLLIMVRNQMLHGGAADDNNRYARHLVARDQLRSTMRSGFARRLVTLLLKRIRYYVALRENTRHYHSMLFDAIRTRLLAVEHELLNDGKLNCAGDIFFLRWNEVDALRNGRIEAREISLLIRERRIAHLRETRALPPETFGIRLPRMPASAADILTGQCACAGAVEGIARIVLRSDQAHALKPGEIMIAPYTDPTWTPLFPSLAGIVVGIGSYLSHAGTIAREYRIPCLVDVKGCIERIADGQRIRLNATEGYVELLPDDVDEFDIDNPGDEDTRTDANSDGSDPPPAISVEEARRLALDLIKAYK